MKKVTDNRPKMPTPSLIRVYDQVQRMLPLSAEAADFARECMEDIWNTGPDTGKGPVLENLTLWASGWHRLERVVDTINWLPQGLITGYFKEGLITGYLKEATVNRVPTSMRIQCIVVDERLVDGFVDLRWSQDPLVQFAWEVKSS